MNSAKTNKKKISEYKIDDIKVLFSEHQANKEKEKQIK